MKTEYAKTAKEMRNELKDSFPETKFHVTSKGYSGGSSVHVRWSGNLSEKEVYGIIKKYQYGYFDGMQDLYETTNRRQDIPQVKFVFADREKLPE